MKTCQMCGLVFPNRIDVDGTLRVVNSRRYCISCSPYGKHNTKRLDRCGVAKAKKCSKCGETDEASFYANRFYTCKVCHNGYSKLKVRDNKRYAVDRLGGRCVRCGFDLFKSALCFHHLDPSVKDENFTSFLGWERARIDAELDKCVLLCLNCHAGIHSGDIAIP